MREKVLNPISEIFCPLAFAQCPKCLAKRVSNTKPQWPSSCRARVIAKIFGEKTRWRFFSFSKDLCNCFKPMYLCVACMVAVNLLLEEKRGNTNILKNIEEKRGNANILKNYEVRRFFRNIELLQENGDFSANITLRRGVI